ncbi:MAG: HlyD family efflux transporter periplasmic adaptor subunit [Deltaproteobacteria bacterium]|nr:HlyD family efflux transporter periplasmic adaptor subunit [Deltaproteobacteria bacterium]
MSGVVAVMSSDPSDVERIRRAAGSGFDVVNAIDAAAMVEVAEADAVVVVSQDRVDAALAAFGEGGPLIIVIGEGAPADPRIAHVVRRQLPPEQLRPLLRCLIDRHPVHAHDDGSPHDPVEARLAQRAFTATRRLAGASDLASTEQIVGDALLELVDADRAHVLFFDADDGALWSEAKLRGTSGDDRRAIGGLAGWAARTGLGARTSNAATDPRWSAEIDDPEASSQLLVHPVIGADGQVHAVLVAVRRARRSEFTDTEAALLARFAVLSAPLLDQLSIHVQSQAILDEAAGDPGIFRKEAIDAQALPSWGDVVRVSPSWISWAYWALVVLLIGSIVFIMVGRVSTYSSGPAIVRSTARTTVIARTSGTVASVEHTPGDPVLAGDVVARLDDTDQRAAVDRLGHEFETQLRNHLLDPADATTESTLHQVRIEFEAARTDLDLRVIRAKSDGVVGDVKVRLGQPVEPGDIVASLTGDVGSLEVIALLPGEDRPRLAPGMTLRFELLGYRFAYRTLTIESVSADVLSPAEARRLLGPEVADDIALNGPVVVVKAKLPSGEFESEGRTLQYHDGMPGAADVRVRSEPIVYALIPGLRRF